MLILACASLWVPAQAAPLEKKLLEKCYGANEGTAHACTSGADSGKCPRRHLEAEKGHEFRYVPAGTCTERGGSLLWPKPPLDENDHARNHKEAKK